jgi:hypothetical protein
MAIPVGVRAFFRKKHRQAGIAGLNAVFFILYQNDKSEKTPS